MTRPGERAVIWGGGSFLSLSLSLRFPSLSSLDKTLQALGMFLGGRELGLNSCLPLCDRLSSEQGDFVVLELGATGASLRVLWVTLTGTEGHWTEPRSREFLIPQEVMLGPGQQVRAPCQAVGPQGGWGSAGQS